MADKKHTLPDEYAQGDRGTKYLGALQPRHAREITASNWAIGGETMDRDYTDYAQWRSYLGPLGAKLVRLQAGWAKCEPARGTYDFAWLDTIIDDVRAQGVAPWLQTSYGNPIYEGGGDVYLGGGMPTSDAALAAWDRWVAALAARYRDRVKVWEVWNESDLNEDNPPEAYAALYVRTAEIIRAAIPDARLFALSLAHVKETGYVETFLDVLQGQDKLHLVDEITVHGYTRRPEAILPAYEELRALIRRYSDRIRLRQGELGCPSEEQPYYALSNYPWTEVSQTKWVLRRLLGDLGHDIPSLYFTIIDIVYERVHERKLRTINRKGLLRANEDKTVAGVKPAYRAFQNLTTIFDASWVRVPGITVEAATDHHLAAFGYRREDQDGSRAQLLTLWFDDAVPTNDVETTPMDLTVCAGDFDIGADGTLAYVDLRTGEVRALPGERVVRAKDRVTLIGVPLYDSPVLITNPAHLTYRRPASREVSRSTS
jgi:hypothetical protein